MITNKTQLLALMQNGATVITPNNRLTQALLSDFFNAHRQPVQDKPCCLPYSAFLQDRFKKLCYNYPQIPHPLLLTAQQLRYLWYELVANFTNDTPNDGFLQAIEEAWTRCHLWQIDLGNQAFASTPQAHLFHQLSLELQQKLNKLSAITEAQLATYLLSEPFGLTRLKGHQDSLIWACFDDYTPQQLALQNHFTAQGYQLIHYDLGETDGTSYCYAAKDEYAEYQQLIHWLKERLDFGEKRIAVVVPDLQVQSKRLQRLFQQQFSTTEFNISLGKALIDYPLVAHALSWLALDGDKLSNYQARLILHSPYLADSQTEMLARAQLLEDSIVLKELQFNQTAFLAELNDAAPKLAELVKKMAKYPTQASPQCWINAFTTRLISLGFPGQYPLNSESYQCYQRFLNLFTEFRQLCLITTKMTQTTALTALKNLAKSTIFQPQKSGARIQVLGLLEALGCTFDSLWVTGLTDQNFPQQTRPSPFIPIRIQREKLMPHASPARELALAQKALARFLNSSKLRVFSYPRLSSDKPNMPSPLLAAISPFPAYQISKPLTPSSLVNLEENYQIPFAKDEQVTGGTAILANQAKCPFQAFAAHRLHAKTPLETSDGPDAKERGQLIHRVMELIWSTLESQENLLALHEEELAQQIEQAIHQALEPLIRQRTHSFTKLVQDVEFARLKRLAQVCLDFDKQRPPFTIEALEQTLHLQLAGINFRVRVDRIDRNPEGKKWVIDYKSNLPKCLPWKEERPQEPQLLLYALLDENIKVLLYVQLKAGQLTSKGLSEENLPLGGTTVLKKDENWAAYRQNWQTQLNELAEEFHKGFCPPEPSSNSICQQCNYQNLCRKQQ
jgi:ATP-dependent helicase/nuclease subunit B